MQRIVFIGEINIENLCTFPFPFLVAEREVLEIRFSIRIALARQCSSVNPCIILVVVFCAHFGLIDRFFVIFRFVVKRDDLRSLLTESNLRDAERAELTVAVVVPAAVIPAAVIPAAAPVIIIVPVVIVVIIDPDLA